MAEGCETNFSSGDVEPRQLAFERAITAKQSPDHGRVRFTPEAAVNVPGNDRDSPRRAPRGEKERTRTCSIRFARNHVGFD